MDAGQERIRVGRLDEVVIEARAERGLAVFALAVAGQRDQQRVLRVSGILRIRRATS